MSTISNQGHEDHARIREHLDHLQVIAGELERYPMAGGLAGRLEEEMTYVDERLLTHADWVEESMYPQLEQLLQDGHSMATMRGEHVELRELAVDLHAHSKRAESDELEFSEVIALRRSLYRFFALAKVHLAEEEAFRRLLEHDAGEPTSSSLRSGLERALSQPL